MGWKQFAWFLQKKEKEYIDGAMENHIWAGKQKESACKSGPFSPRKNNRKQSHDNKVMNHPFP